MSAKWFVAKYTPDLRRREPRNVGVIVVADGGVRLRFLGQKTDGGIDGRHIRWAGDPETYKAWVEHWQDVVARQTGDWISELTERLGDSNYFIESGGRHLAGTARDESALADWLYSVLIDDGTDGEMLSVADLSEAIINRLELGAKVRRNETVTIPRRGKVDRFKFDYRYDNGSSTLMQRVALTLEDARSWDAVHAAAWSFKAVAQAQQLDFQEPQLIALVRTGREGQELADQIGVLEDHAKVVRVNQEDIATRQLAHLLHLDV